MSIKVGDKVPNFTATTNKGVISLNDYLGKYIILYFYPRDNTRACSIEANDFKTLYLKFKEQNAEVIGVSINSLAMHDKFECKYELPFPLIADTDCKVCDLFGVIKHKILFFNSTLYFERTTFLIDVEGKLIKEWRKIEKNNHAQEVLDFLINTNKVL